MQVLETQNEGLKRQFKVTVAAIDINKRLDSRLTELSRTLRLPGFRPGKVPVSLMRQRYGNSVYKEVLEDMARDSSDDLLRERNLRPSRQPQVSASTIENNGDFVYDLTVEVLPEITVMDIAKLDLVRETAEITEADIDLSLSEFLSRVPFYSAAPDGHKAAKGDRVIIDYIGKLEGKPFLGGTAHDFRLDLGSGQFVPGFEDGLIGAKAGENRTLKLKFPADYHADNLAGQDTEFSVTIKQIDSKATETLEDTAKRLKFESVEELREYFKNRIKQEFDAQSRTKLKIKLLDQLNNQHNFALPLTMVEEEFKTIWAQMFEGEKDSVAPPLPSDDKKAVDHPLMTVAKQREYLRIAERRVRVGLVLSEIARLNNISVTDTELRHAMRDTANNYRGQEKRVLDYLNKNPAAQERLRGPILEEKIVNFIFQLAKIKDSTVSREELFKLDDEIAALADDSAESKKSGAKSAKKSAKSDTEAANGDSSAPAKDESKSSDDADDSKAKKLRKKEPSA